MKKILISVIILIIGFGAGYGLHSYLTKGRNREIIKFKYVR